MDCILSIQGRDIIRQIFIGEQKVFERGRRRQLRCWLTKTLYSIRGYICLVWCFGVKSISLMCNSQKLSLLSLYCSQHGTKKTLCHKESPQIISVLIFSLFFLFLYIGNMTIFQEQNSMFNRHFISSNFNHLGIYRNIRFQLKI